jgi:hypothetical protein
VSRHLPDPSIAAIVTADSDEAIATSAHQIGLSADTVRRVRRRLRAAGGWRMPLRWVTCIACGGSLATHPSSGRTAHHLCEPDRIVRTSRHRRQVGGVPSPTGHTWPPRAPAAIAAEQERERARGRARRRAHGAIMTPEEPAAGWARAAAWTQQTNDLTALYADAWRNPWTEDDDRFLLEHPTMRHQDVALELGRTYHAIRARRRVLRLRRLPPESSRCPRPSSAAPAAPAAAPPTGRGRSPATRTPCSRAQCRSWVPWSPQCAGSPARGPAPGRCRRR